MNCGCSALQKTQFSEEKWILFFSFFSQVLQCTRTEWLQLCSFVLNPEMKSTTDMITVISVSLGGVENPQTLCCDADSWLVQAISSDASHRHGWIESFLNIFLSFSLSLSPAHFSSLIFFSPIALNHFICCARADVTAVSFMRCHRTRDF